MVLSRQTIFILETKKHAFESGRIVSQQMLFIGFFGFFPRTKLVLA